MIDCAQCCYNACVILSCMSLNAALLTTDQRLQAILGQRRAQMNTVQMKEYVRLGKIGLLSSCEHMGEYFWFNKCPKSCLWTNTWLSYCNNITHHKAHGEETRHSGIKYGKSNFNPCLNTFTVPSPSNTLIIGPL